MRRAVVVGAGPNGLAGAVRLAQAGLEVTVLEAADEIGGGTRSAELLEPGIVHDICSAFHPLGAASPYLRTLGLERYGLRFLRPEIDAAHPLDDGTAGLFYQSVEKTAAGLGADGRRWRAIFGPVAKRFSTIADDALGPMLRIPRHPLDFAGFAVRSGLPATLLARAFSTPQARALFIGIAAHPFVRLNRIGTAAGGVMLTAAGHVEGWPVAEGGSAAITRALAAKLADLGGRIETGTTVTSRADLDADIVLLDTDPTAAQRILGTEQPSRTARTYRGHRGGPGAFKVDYVVEGEVGWTAPGCDRAGVVHLGGTMEQVVRAENTVLDGRMPDDPFVLIGQQWLADPSRAKGDRKPLWAYAHVPRGYTGDATEAVTAQIERFAPGFSSRIRASRSIGPAELEVENPNYVGGDIGGGRNDLWHLVARPRLSPNPYATGVDGVYLCSSSTPPGGGVHGMCGFRAAEAALRG
ncbi:MULTISPECIES: phytoene desaturase family protein [Gordonia]|uniref:phytoene desaturase family protein n=1 Tax=Gordonia TaxID=2053 RepID=UPI0009592C7E|nr:MULTISPECIES: NAD(P)/FAD-dependent oxidoreductase [Gordonia]MDH3013053.1 NAD(P)/FAD-dependent oxidoreductase [Gordonia alkanivorans]OLT45584.1 FAD-dependent oxidoreductase [Gordonia sp. CNJ-863]